MSKTKLKIYVDDEYFDLVPRPTKEQRNALKESIRQQGQLEPIIVDYTGKIIDGHTRYDICEELGIKTDYVIRKFKSESEKKLFVITTNLKRRQLNDFQIYELYEAEINIIQKLRKVKTKKRKQDVWSGKLPPKTKNEYQSSSFMLDVEKMTGIKNNTISNIRYIKKYGTSYDLEELRTGNQLIYQLARKIADTITNKKNDFRTYRKIKSYRNRLFILRDLLTYLSKNQDVITFHVKSDVIKSKYFHTYLTTSIESGFISATKREKYDSTCYNITPKGSEILNQMNKLLEKIPAEFGGLKE